MPTQLDADSAKERVIEGLIHLTLAMNVAKVENPGGTVGLAVISKNSDNSGRVTAQLDGFAFLGDIIKSYGFEDFNDMVAKTTK
jgi:NADH:ubiquinone oxidoreductase subunit D